MNTNIANNMINTELGDDEHDDEHDDEQYKEIFKNKDNIMTQSKKDIKFIFGNDKRGENNTLTIEEVAAQEADDQLPFPPPPPLRRSTNKFSSNSSIASIESIDGLSPLLERTKPPTIDLF